MVGCSTVRSCVDGHANFIYLSEHETAPLQAGLQRKCLCKAYLNLSFWTPMGAWT